MSPNDTDTSRRSPGAWPVAELHWRGDAAHSSSRRHNPAYGYATIYMSNGIGHPSAADDAKKQYKRAKKPTSAPDA
jgi:hypothetical protein